MNQRRSLEVVLVAGVLLICIALFVLGGLWVRYIRTSDDSTLEVRHTHDVIRQLNELKISLLEVENLEHGYLINGLDKVLPLYDATLANTQTLQGKVTAVVADNPEQTQNAATIKALVDTKLVASHRLVDLRRTDGLVSARAILTSGQDQDEYRVIHGLIDQMRSIEDQQLKQRRQAAHDAFENIKQLAGVSVAAMMLMMLGLGFAIRKDLSLQTALVKQLDDIGHQDVLTGLPNRRYFSSAARTALSLAARNQRMSAVLMLDLDGFKPVNEMHGDKVGNLILREASERIKRTIRTSDFVARLQGDEFVVLLPEVIGVGTVTAVARKLLKSVEAPYKIADEGEPAKLIGLSIGIAMSPHHGTDLDTLIQHSDMALLKAKQAGKGQYAMFSDTDGNDIEALA